MIRRRIISVLIVCWSICIVKADNQPLDSLQQVLGDAIAQSDQTLEADLLHQIGSEYLQKEEITKALEYFNKVKSLYAIIKNDSLKLENTFSLGLSYQKLNTYPKALEYYFEYLKVGEGILKDTQKANAKSRIAAIYQAIGDFKLAYDYQLQSLAIKEKLQDSLGILRSYYQIGSIFFFQSNYEKAKVFYEKAKGYAEQMNNQKAMFSCLAAIGSIYDRKEVFDTAYQYNLESFHLAEKLNYKTGLAYAHHNIGSNLLGTGDLEQSLIHLNKSLKLKQELQDKWGQIGTLNTIAFNLKKQKKYNSAIQYVQQSLDLCRDLGAKAREVEIHKSLAEIYTEANNLSGAVNSWKRYAELKDSILNESTLLEMSERKNRYDIQTRETEIADLKQQTEILEKEKVIQNLYVYLGIFILLSLATIIFILNQKYRSHKRLSLQLAEKNKEINDQNTELSRVNNLVMEINNTLKEKTIQIENQNEKLAASNRELENFAYVASHDLKEPLRMMSAYIGLLKRRHGDKFDESAKEFMHYITDGAERMTQMLDDLLVYSRVGRTGKTEEVSTQNILQVVESTLDLEVNEKKAQLNIAYDNLPNVTGNKTQLTQLFQNLVSNALKFQDGEAPQVWVDCKKNGKYYIFSVKDNGIGISPEHKDHIFEMFRRLHSHSEYKGTGIGLATCKKIVDKCGGNIWVESEVGEGSTFYFTIPYSAS